VLALERLNLPFTGADSYSYEPSRERMKRAALSSGVDTPSWYFCKTDEDIDVALKELSLPVITKHFGGYNSVGMTKDSKCTTAEGFRKEARRFIQEFGEVLVEVRSKLLLCSLYTYIYVYKSFVYIFAYIRSSLMVLSSQY
jgi:hypothetical protein